MVTEFLTQPFTTQRTRSGSVKSSVRSDVFLGTAAADTVSKHRTKMLIFFHLARDDAFRVRLNTDSNCFTVSPQNAIFPHAAIADGANIDRAANSDRTGKPLSAPWTDIIAFLLDCRPRIHHSDDRCCADDFPERSGNL